MVITDTNVGSYIPGSEGVEKRASGENGVGVAGRDCGSDGTVGQTDEQEVVKQQRRR